MTDSSAPFDILYPLVTAVNVFYLRYIYDQVTNRRFTIVTTYHQDVTLGPLCRMVTISAFGWFILLQVTVC